MPYSSLLSTYVGSGTFASRPVAATIAATVPPGWVAFYYSTDTSALYGIANGDVAWTNFTGSGFTAASTTEQLTGTSTTKGSTPDSVAALWEQGSDVASGGTISLGEGGYFFITGTTTITDIDFATDKAGRMAWVKFVGILTLTHNASTLILPTGANITTAAGDTACFISEGADAVRCVAYNRASGAALAGSSSGSLIGIQTITATGAGTYTPTAGTNSIVMELIGGGAGGGAVAQPTGSNVATGAGGGAGGWLTKRLTTAFSGAGYVVGAKGTGGIAGANAGNNGSDTTFTATGGGGTVYTAGGGTGGPTLTAAAAPLRSSSGAGGTATNGDINVPGAAGLRNLAVSTACAIGGTGGFGRYANSPITSAVSAVNTSSAGAAAAGKGGGGGGGVAVGTGAAVAGGDGSDGMIIIWEYS